MGFPDLLVVQNGAVAFYEVKVFKGSVEQSLDRVTALQWATLGQLRRAGAGAWAIVIKSPQEVYLAYEKTAI